MCFISDDVLLHTVTPLYIWSLILQPQFDLWGTNQLRLLHLSNQVAQVVNEVETLPETIWNALCKKKKKEY